MPDRDRNEDINAAFMIDSLDYTITATIWMYQGKGAWFFVTLPKEEADQIKFFSTPIKRGWGSVCVKATIGDTSWKTSIFPDSKTGSYILPIKAEIRKKGRIGMGDTITVRLVVSL